MHTLGLQVAMPALQPDAFPFWDSCMMVLSVAAMILMTRKYVENWLLWVIINVISVVIFALQGVYAMSLEYLLLTFIALNGSRMWINSARERGSHAFSPLMVMMMSMPGVRHVQTALRAAAGLILPSEP
ncbi:ribosyl nicotinamide transporter [Klebsiella michiganensis]|uniref:Nicotinamide riboside transporter PnuC n=1 Tax=Klebsiella michiganensis TaxID=1134687 RepID=A0A7H4N3Q9_9ENTR|nr:ribosyl nicotinamide transporter [Klebsiella michiganensis]